MIRKFVKDSSWVLGSNILSKAINFITLGFLARVLGPDQLGFYNAIQNTGNYVNMMSSLGTIVVIQRVGAKIKELGVQMVSEIFSNVFTLYLLINTLAAIVLALFPGYFFELLLDSRGNINFVFLISVIIVLNALVQLPLSLMLGLQEFKKYAIRNLLISVLMLGISVSFILSMEDKAKAAYYGLVVSFGLNVLLTGYVILGIVREYMLTIRITLNFKILKKVLADGFIYYAGNTFLGAMVGLVTISLFYKYLTSYEYGFTRIGNAVGVILSILPAAIQPVTISLLSVEHARNNYLKSIQIRIIPFLSTVFLVAITFNLELILNVFFGHEYIGARNIVFGMVLVQIPYLYLGLINNYQVGIGNLNFIGWVAIMGCLIMIGGCFLFIPWWGIKGYFAAMYISTFAALGLVAFKEYYKKGQLSQIDWNSIWTNLFLAILAYCMMYMLPNPIRIPVTILVMGLSAFFFWRFCMDVSERALILAEIQSKLIKAKRN